MQAGRIQEFRGRTTAPQLFGEAALSFQRSNGRADCSYDLGVEPPIVAHQTRQAQVDRRSVSLRWLSGVVLTLVSGSTLIGSAIYAALDRETTFAEAPAPAVPVKRDVAPGLLVNPKKADRLVKSVDIVAARQTFRTPTTVKIGNREVVRARAFTRVSTPLTLVATGFAEDVPRFNPLKLLAGNGPGVVAPELAAEPETAQDDAEVSFVTRDLTDVDARGATTLSLTEVQAQVTEFVANALVSGSRPNLPLPPQLLLMRTSRAGLDPTGGLAYARPDSPISTPFTSIEVRMVPENVTLIPKAAPAPEISTMQERLAVVRRGEVLTDILKANGATPEQSRAIVAAFGMKRNETPVREGQKVKLLLADLDGSGTALQIARISVYTDETVDAVVAITDSNQYIQVEKAGPAMARHPSGEGDDEDSGGIRLYDSLYETALKQEMPRPIIDDLVRIFGNDVDFQRPVAGGDSFEAFYEENEENENRNELLYASITARGEVYRYYRFQSSEDNLLDYYDEKGRSARKFLVRQPVQGVRISSGFGRRYHPIMRYSKMHTGVDFAGPTGTPIFAAGNGTIIKAGWDSGYGRRIEIQHANGYVTTYNHQSAFAKGIKEGVRVRQGQVIGYIGSTGLSTGAHLHYEVIVNGNFVDPMRIRLSRTRELNGKAQTEFQKERERIDALISKAPNAAPIAGRPATTAAAASTTATR